MFKYKKVMLAAIAVMYNSSWSAYAEEQYNNLENIEVITVKGGKRPKSLNDVPASVSVLSAEQLAQMKVENMADMSLNMPNVSISANAIQDTISIRGIHSDLQAGGEQSVGIFVDGVYHGRGVQSRFLFLDVETLEVLRGPQGALFGKNTIGGVLSINPSQPTEDIEAKITTGWETESEQIETFGYITGALNQSATVKGRLAYKYKDNNKGFIENVSKDETGLQQEDLSYRGILQWDISNAVNVNLRVESGDQESNGIFWESTKTAGPLAPLIIALGEDGVVNHKGSGSNGNYPGLGYKGEDTSYYMDTNFDEVSFKANYVIEQGTFTAILAQSDYDFVRSQDADFGPLAVLQFTDREDFEQTSAELRFVSNDSDVFEYIVGVYFNHSELMANAVTDTATAPNTSVGSVYNSAILNMTGGALDIYPEHSITSRYHALDQESDSWAVYTQVGIGLTDDIKLELSARFSNEEKDATQLASLYGGTGDGSISGLPISSAIEQSFWSVALLEVTPHTTELKRSESHFTPSATLTWSVANDINFYASYSQGVKGGGFNSFAMTADPEEAEYDEEKARSYELGGKFSLLENDLRLNVALFNTEFDDMQTSQFTGGTTFIVANAAKATSQGIEMDLSWAITDDWKLHANAGYLDFEYDSYTNAGCTSAQIVEGGFANGAACSAAGTNDLSGRENQDTPKLTAMLGVEYGTMLGEFEVVSRINANYTDDFFAASDLDEDSKVDAFTLVDASIKVVSPDGDWDVTLIGRNLTDEKYFFFHNDTPLLTGSHQGGTAAPATYTLQFSFHFIE